MKNFFLLMISFFFVQLSFSQIKPPVKWSFHSKKIDAVTYEVQLTAQIEEDWHIYSQSTPQGGPVPTSVSFLKNPLATLKGGVREIGKMEEHFEELFGVTVKQYAGKVSFVQTITTKPGIKTAVNGSIEFMACNDHECMPPQKQKFSIALN